MAVRVSECVDIGTWRAEDCKVNTLITCTWNQTGRSVYTRGL